MFQSESQGAIEVVTPEVALNQETAPKLLEVIAEKEFTGQPMVVLNMAQVPMLDSAGLEAIIDVQQNLRSSSGTLKIAGLTQLCQDVFRVTGLVNQFEIFAETESAVRSFLR